MEFFTILPSTSSQKIYTKVTTISSSAQRHPIKTKLSSGRLHPQKLLELGEQFLRNGWLDFSIILPSASTQKIYRKVYNYFQLSAAPSAI